MRIGAVRLPFTRLSDGFLRWQVLDRVTLSLDRAACVNVGIAGSVQSTARRSLPGVYTAAWHRNPVTLPFVVEFEMEAAAAAVVAPPSAAPDSPAVDILMFGGPAFSSPAAATSEFSRAGTPLDRAPGLLARITVPLRDVGEAGGRVFFAATADGVATVVANGDPTTGRIIACPYLPPRTPVSIAFVLGPAVHSLRGVAPTLVLSCPDLLVAALAMTERVMPSAPFVSELVPPAIRRGLTPVPSAPPPSVVLSGPRARVGYGDATSVGAGGAFGESGSGGSHSRPVMMAFSPHGLSAQATLSDAMLPGEFRAVTRHRSYHAVAYGSRPLLPGQYFEMEVVAEEQRWAGALEIGLAGGIERGKTDSVTNLRDLQSVHPIVSGATRHQPTLGSIIRVEHAGSQLRISSQGDAAMTEVPIPWPPSVNSWPVVCLYGRTSGLRMREPTRDEPAAASSSSSAAASSSAATSLGHPSSGSAARPSAPPVLHAPGMQIRMGGGPATPAAPPVPPTAAMPAGRDPLDVPAYDEEAAFLAAIEASRVEAEVLEAARAADAAAASASTRSTAGSSTAGKQDKAVQSDSKDVAGKLPECVLCEDEVRHVACIPCGHLSMCTACANDWISKCDTAGKKATCPMCQKELQEPKILRIFIV